MKTVKILGDTLNKVADTSTVFNFRLWNGGQAQDVAGKAVSFVIANDSGYLFDVPAVVDGNVISLDFSNELLKQLTPDTYHLEVSVTKGDGDVEVYPSAGAIDFTVGKNLHSTQGKLVPQITFDTVLSSVDKKIAEYTKTIAKGDKGDKGDTGSQGPQGIQGPQGPQGSTGPQGPKGDMDLSQITVGGRNLLLDTARSISGVGVNKPNLDFTDPQVGTYYLAGGKTVSDLYNQYGPTGYLTLSFDWVASGDTISGTFNPMWNQSPWSGLSITGSIKPSITNKSGHYVSTVQLNFSGADYSTGTATGVKFRQESLQGNVTISNLKLEVGNVATDWTPAPEDLFVGGRNLMLGSADWSGGGARWNFRASVTSNTYRGTVIAATTRSFNNTPVYILKNAGILQVGKTYTFSTYVRNTSDTDAKIGYYYEAGMMTPSFVDISLPAHTEWKRIFVTFQLLKDTTTSDYGLRWESKQDVTNGEIQFASYKLEEGNIPTDWTPAPEDVPSNDAQLVHKTGNETIAGDKTLVGNTTLATTTILAGNYGLRVTASGIQKMTDGKTWVSANI